MKNARLYEKRMKKLLSQTGKVPPASPVPPDERVLLMIRSILEEDTTREKGDRILEAIRKEYVDFNELRVSPPKEIVELAGREFPGARLKGEALPQALDAVFDKTCTMSMDYMDKLTKRDLRRHLLEIGLSPYAAAAVVLQGFAGHAIPVDGTLVEVLQMDGLAHPGSDLAEVQGFLERIVPQKNALAAHELLRKYIRKRFRVLQEKRRAEAEVRARQEKKRQEELAAQAAAEAAEAARKAAEEARKAEEKARKEQEKAARKAAAQKEAGRKAAAQKAAARKAAKTHPRGSAEAARSKPKSK